MGLRWTILPVAGAAVLGAGSLPPTTPPPGGLVERTEADRSEPLCRFGGGLPDGSETVAVDGPELPEANAARAVVNAYGSHVPEYVASGVDWSTGAPVVMASFAAHVAEHRAAIEELVDGDVVVCRAAMTDGEAAALAAELQPRLEGLWRGYGTNFAGRLEITLRPGTESVAEELIADYGDAVELSIGLFPYPVPDPLPESHCTQLPAAVPIEIVAADPSDLTTPADADLPVELTMANTSDEQVTFETGLPPRGVLVEAGSSIPVAITDGMQFGVGYTVDLDPGETFSAAVTVPTATCDPADGYTVAPGHYDLYAVFDTAEHPSGEFAVGPVPVEIERDER